LGLGLFASLLFFFFLVGTNGELHCKQKKKKTQTNRGTPTTTLGAKTQEIITQSYHKFGFGSQHK
jgi:hypothetical protein